MQLWENSFQGGDIQKLFFGSNDADTCLSIRYWEYLSLCVDGMDFILFNIIYRKTQMEI